jgi:excisionase family DNA binding protein
MAESKTKQRLLTTQELADFLGKRASWLHQRADDLGIPSIRVGRHRRWDLEKVLKHLESHA